MNSKLVAALERGMELRIPDTGTSYPVDFVVIADTGSLVFLIDWWDKWPDGFGSVIYYVSGPAEPTTDGFWSFTRTGPLLASFSDENAEAAFKRARMYAALNLKDYMVAIRAAAKVHSDFDFAPWIDAALARPRDHLQQVIEDETRMRPVGKILLRNDRGAVVDSLVIDENGLAATAREETPGLFAAFAERWMSFTADDRPPLMSYLTWAADQPVYGPYAITGAEVFSASGSAHQIALASVSVTI